MGSELQTAKMSVSVLALMLWLAPPRSFLTETNLLGLVDISSCQLPAGWTCMDISTTGGSAIEAAGIWTVHGNGGGIEDKADSFHYVYKEVSGDCEIIARLAAIQPTDEWAKAGVMIRNTLQPDSPHVFMALTPWSRTALQYRCQSGQRSYSVHSDNYKITFPCWVRLVREGDRFTGYYSADGKNWVAQPNYENRIPDWSSNPATVSMDHKVYIGLAVTSHRSDGLLCRTKFDNVATSSQPDLQIRTDDEQDFAGDNVYDISGYSISGKQTKKQVAAKAMTVIYDIKLENDGPVLDSFIIFGFGGDENWSVMYYDVSTGANITKDVTSIGWRSPSLVPRRYRELNIKVTPKPALSEGSRRAGSQAEGSGTPGYSVCSLLVRAMSSSDRSRVDTVRAETVFDPDLPAPPWSGLYTTDEDFDKGILINVEHQAEPNQLQLSAQPGALPFIWVPNSNQEEGTVSKLDTKTAAELGRYRTCPANVFGSPSRTTVDLDGNCWVANRNSGTVVKIGLLENGQCVDRNGNGIIETSRDLDGDGKITGDEVLPWGADECVIFELVLIPGKEGTYTPGRYRGSYKYFEYNQGPRAIAVDKENNIWAGCFGSMMYYYIDGASGQILRRVDVSTAYPGGHTPYGAVVDANGILWSAGHGKGHVLRLDPADNDSCSIIELGHFAYGLGLGLGLAKSYLFVSGWGDSKLSRIRLDYRGDANGITTWDGFPWSRGVACTDNGDVWVVNSYVGKSQDVGQGAVTHCNMNGQIIERIHLGDVPTGVAVDGDGKVWVVNYGDEFVHRIDPNTHEILKIKLSGNHYGYSDMTGLVAWNPTVKTGWWTVVHNTKAFDCRLASVWCKADVPRGASLKFTARSSNDRRHWSTWQDINDRCALCSLPSGRYFEIKVAFKSETGDSPRLYELGLHFADHDDSYRQADLNRDYVVDFRDLQTIANDWLSCNSGSDKAGVLSSVFTAEYAEHAEILNFAFPSVVSALSAVNEGPDQLRSLPDLNGDCVVDLKDFQVLAADWLLRNEF